jgi:CSLREA domain-containing protein
MLAVAVGALSLAGAQDAGAATLRVNTTRDQLAAHGRRCSLREAIITANSPGRRTPCGIAGRRTNTISLGSGRYVLSIAPSRSDGPSSGDLELNPRAPLTITGAGASATVVDAHALGDRALVVGRGSRVTLLRLTITGGHARDGASGAAGITGASCASGGAGRRAGGAGEGGAIYNNGTLTLNRVMLAGNTAGSGGAGGAGAAPSGTAGCAGGGGGPGGEGGGVYNWGHLTVIDSTIRGNVAGTGGAGGAGAGSTLSPGGPGGKGGPGGRGGGIYNHASLVINASTIADNRAGEGGVGGPGGAGVGTNGTEGIGGPGGPGGAVFSTHGTMRATNSTLVGNVAGRGGPGGAGGGTGGDGGAIAVMAGRSWLLGLTIARSGAGPGAPAAAPTRPPGRRGTGAALFVQSPGAADDMRVQNTLIASNGTPQCARSAPSAITNGGHDLRDGDRTCPGRAGNPRLGHLKDNGGPTETIALGRNSAAINRIPRRGCEGSDQRGVHRPQGNGCDIGAFEFATPKITVISPNHHGSYERGARVRARFYCTEGGIFSPIARCMGSVAQRRAIKTGRVGTRRFVVTAVDKSGNRARRIVRYVVWKYSNPLRDVRGLTPRRIDLGVDYAGSGPLLALGKGRVTTASNTDSGPESCWAISCWPGGGIVVYRLLDGPFAGKYVYVAEHITVTVRAGQLVRAGQPIATLHAGYPWSEFGWAAGRGPEALAMADGHRCSCSDPGGWSTIEGRNFNHLLVQLGAPPGYLQSVPNQSMPAGWPTWSG